MMRPRPSGRNSRPCSHWAGYAVLSSKQLLALWNALPGVEKRKKVGDRTALIDQLWLAIEALPDPEPQPDMDRLSKQDGVIAMLRRPEGQRSMKW